MVEKINDSVLFCPIIEILSCLREPIINIVEMFFEIFTNIFEELDYIINSIICPFNCIINGSSNSDFICPVFYFFDYVFNDFGDILSYIFKRFGDILSCVFNRFGDIVSCCYKPILNVPPKFCISFSACLS